MMSRQRRAVGTLVAAFTTLLVPSAAIAGPARTTTELARTITELRTRVSTGEVVHVIDREGRETKGPLVSLSDTALVLAILDQKYEVPLDRVARIDRDGDSLWNGTSIGAGIGAALGLLARQGCSGDCTAEAMLSGAIVYGGFGALLDWAHRGRTALYAAPLTDSRETVALAPIVSRGRRGAALAVRW